MHLNEGMNVVCFVQNWISSFRKMLRKKNEQSLTLCNVGFWTSCLLTTLDIINLFCLTLSAVMYCGSEDIRYFWMFSWDDIIRGGGGGGTGVGRQLEPASPVDDAVSFWLGSVFKVLGWYNFVFKLTSWWHLFMPYCTDWIWIAVYQWEKRKKYIRIWDNFHGKLSFFTMTIFV